MLGLLRTLLAISWRLLLLSGWIAFGLLALLFGAEASGILTAIARDFLQDASGPVPVHVEHAGVRLFPARIAISGLRIGELPQAVQLDSLELDWSLNFDEGFRIRGLRARGGSAQWAREWMELGSGADGRAATPAGFGALADLELRVENLALSIRSDRWGTLPLGRLDLEGRIDAAGELSWKGRLRPRFSPDGSRRSEIIVQGSRTANGEQTNLEWYGAAVPLSLSYLPDGQLLEQLRPWQPKGTLDIEGQLSIAQRTTGRIRARVLDADLVVARGTQRLQSMQLDLEARLDAGDWKAALAPDAWEGRAQLQGGWEGAMLSAAASLLDGKLAGYAAIKNIPLDERIVDIAGSSAKLREIWRGFAPRGKASVLAGWEWPLALSAEQGLRLAVELDPQGETGMTYLGWPDEDGRGAGFPLPADNVRGTVVFAREPGTLRPLRTALIDLVARTPAGEILCDGLIGSHAIDAPPFLPGYGYSELDLSISSPALTLGEPVYTALRGLEPTVEAASTWLPFDPRDGQLGVRFRLARTVDTPFAAIDLEAQLKRVQARWEDLPVPIRGLDGLLRVRTDGKGSVTIGFDADGELESARSLRIEARLRTDPRYTGGTAAECASIRARVGSLSVTGEDVKLITREIPQIADALAESGVQGTLDVEYERLRAGRDAQPQSQLVLRPRELQARPRELPLLFEQLSGSVLIDLPDGGKPRVRAAPLLARWHADTPVAVSGDLQERFVVHAAGIDPAAPDLLARLKELVGGEELETVRLGGRIDLDAELLPASEDPFRARMFLRGNSLEIPGSLALDNLRGRVDYGQSRLSGDQLLATLAGSQLELMQLELSGADSGWELRMRLQADEIPLDAAHLSGILDSSTLDALLGDLALQGRVEINDAQLRISGASGRKPRLEFSGDLTPTNTTMELGLPLRIGSARARIEQLVLEDDQLRARARIEDLYGDIAGRVLGPASFRLSYIEPLLSIDDLDAALEGGRLLPIGGEQHVSGASFSITLAAPYDFQLGVSLRDVDAAGLLRGLFDSEFATRGRISAELRLEGNTEQLLGLEGSGSLRVRDSRLWSIPVFRALFSQLGLDSTVVFENMQARLRVADGRIILTDMSVESPILQLVGSRGTLDFDGALKFDLELRYTLIDRLGPFTRLFYSVQNRLISVEIRGDMARPFVTLKNPVTSLFGTGRKARALPLPGLSPLPSRF